MNGNPSHDPTSNADRLVETWAVLSARSRPPAVAAETMRPRFERRPVRHRPARNALAALAALLVIVLVVAVGFAVWHQSPVVAPFPSATETVASPSPSATPRSVFAPPTAPPPYFGSIINIGRIDAMNGWAYGWFAAPSSSQRELLMTNDGGATWRNIVPPNAANSQFALDIQFKDANHGWLLGDNGPLWWTADGGRSWGGTSLPSGRTAFGGSMSMVSGSTGYLLLSADTPDSRETWVLYRTDDGGASLNPVGPVPLPNGYGHASMIAFSGALNGVAAQPSDGNSAVFATRDGGRSWYRASVPESAEPGAPQRSDLRYVEQLQPFGPEVVMVASVMISETDTNRFIYASDDGGVSWRVASSWPSKYASDLWTAIDARTWVLVPMVPETVEPMRVSVTTDGGAIWTQSSGTSPTGLYPFADAFVSPTDGWAIFDPVDVRNTHGYGPPPGQLYRTTDGGRTWSPVG